MNEPLRFVVAEGEGGRADAVVAARFPGASRRRLVALFARGAVRVDGARAKKGTAVAPGQTVTVAGAPPSDDDLRPVAAAGALPVLHEDAWLVAIAKPPGMPSHPLEVGETGTAANLLVARWPELRTVGDDPREAGLAHRLDAGTSGVLLACRDPDTWRATRQAFAGGAVRKRYLALVAGRAEPGASQAPLAQRGRVSVVDPDGLPARTRWSVDRRFADATLLGCRAETGRMHQIRAHLAAAGHPLVGDALYGGPPDDEVVAFFLHASSLELAHPHTGEPLRIEAPLPDDRARALDRRSEER